MLIALLTGRAMDVYTRMLDTDANDYDTLNQVHRRWLEEIQGGQARD